MFAPQAPLLYWTCTWVLCVSHVQTTTGRMVRTLETGENPRTNRGNIYIFTQNIEFIILTNLSNVSQCLNNDMRLNRSWNFAWSGADSLHRINLLGNQDHNKFLPLSYRTIGLLLFIRNQNEIKSNPVKSMKRSSVTSAVVIDDVCVACSFFAADQL